MQEKFQGTRRERMQQKQQGTRKESMERTSKEQWKKGSIARKYATNHEKNWIGTKEEHI